MLTGYDFLAFAYIGKRLPAPQVAFASFLSYAVSNNVGFAMLSGASVRYRFYTRWGLTGEELSRIVFSYSVTFWLGLLALGGVSLALQPGARALGPMAAARRAPIGWLLVAALRSPTSAAAAPAAAVPPRPVSTSRCRRCGIAVTQLLLSVVDWALAGAVLYVLLPAGRVAVPGVPRRVPRGDPHRHGEPRARRPGRLRRADGRAAEAVPVDRRTLLPALVVYRAVYYLLPLRASR